MNSTEVPPEELREHHPDHVTLSRADIVRGGIWYIFLLAVVALLVLYLWRPAETRAAPIPQPVTDDLLDCFLVRDVSGSANTQAYESFENKILAELRPGRERDRNSYALFAEDTYIPPPSPKMISLEERRDQLAQTRFCCRTDYAKLFHKLHDAIRDERRVQVESRLPHNSDAIIILSDGVPNLSTGRNPDCKVLNPEFTNTAISREVGNLLDGPYATAEPIYIRLILLGGTPQCERAYQQAWTLYLSKFITTKRDAFAALTEVDDLEDIDSGLLIRGRRPRIILTLSPLPDHERRRLDRHDGFEVQYEARAFLHGGEIRVDHASLYLAGQDVSRSEPRFKALGREEEILFQVSRDHNRPPPIGIMDRRNAVEITLPSPDQELSTKPPAQGSMYLTPLDKATTISEFSRYRLEFMCDCPLCYDKAVLPVEPSGDALAFRHRLGVVTGFYVAIMLLLGIAIGSYKATRTSTTVAFRSIHGYLESILVRWHLRWIELLLLTFLSAMFSAGVRLHNSQFMSWLVVVLGVLLAVLRKYRQSPLVKISYAAIDMALPFLYAVVAAFLV